MTTPLCLTNIRLLPGDGSPPLDDALLCMARGRVVMAGAGLVPPAGARVCNLQGRYVLPGLINAHVHGAHSPESRRRFYLQHGVTALGDLAAPLEAVPLLRRQRTHDGLAAPRTVTAGPALTAPGGYPLRRHGGSWCVEVACAAQAAQTVRLLHAWGARLVKLVFEPGTPRTPRPMLCLEAASAAAQQAGDLGLPVRAHVSEARGLQLALQAGADAIEHLPLSCSDGRPACTSAVAGLRIAPEVDTLLRRMADSGVLLVPTLEALSRSVWDNTPLLALVRRFHESGGRIALGTDAPFAGVSHGAPLRELELLREAGLSTEACLQAAGRNAALACGFENSGLLLPGCRADVLVLQEDPSHDFAALQSPVMVIVAGEVVHPLPA